VSYAHIINQIDPAVNAAGVEAHMRVQYGTLDHLPRETFAAEILLFKECEKVSPGYGARLAKSYGLGGYSTEPTEQGNQYVIPGCEKDRTRGPTQGDLF
jgi:hypothetical protein